MVKVKPAKKCNHILHKSRRICERQPPMQRGHGQGDKLPIGCAPLFFHGELIGELGALEVREEPNEVQDLRQERSGS